MASPINSKLPWFIEKDKSIFYIGGDIDGSCVDEFCIALQQILPNQQLDMSELEIDEGPALAVVISALRNIAPCVLVEAPRMLAHTLYKINCQDIHLQEPRSF